TSWLWAFGDGGTATAQSPSHSYASAGTYTVTLTASNDSGSSSATGTITVTSPPPTAPTASFTSSVSSGTAPLSVTFTDTSTGAPTSWAWTFGDGGSDSSQNPTHSYTSAGTYTVTLTASNGSGSSSATGTITVTGPPPPPNLVGNPGFEIDTTGWSGPLARVSGGHSGSWAAKLTNSGTAPATITLNDHPNWIATTSAGTYTASVWVRSDVAGATAYLKLREYQGSTKVGERVVQVVLTTSWQQLSVTMVPSAPGSSTIDLNSYVYNAAAGSSFYADDVEVRLT
ncbi:MAG: PKD domain-containing protein, partial [Actinomycetota bacterium]|nr:PKD domain-containing protein [Actinomycetota bacterium]